MKIDKDKLNELAQGIPRPSSAETDAASAPKTAGAELKTAGEKATVNPAGSTADKVDLSSLKNEVERLKAKAKGAPDIDEEKVARIKKALESGTYNVDARTVARSILKDHLSDEID